jgi:two-component system, cell cycle response regulator
MGACHQDLRDQAELCLDVCAQAGLNTTAAATGAQGYKKAWNTRPDVILLDVMLPDMDGWDVCRQLRSDPQTSDIPIVVLTARDEAHGARRAREAGSDRPTACTAPTDGADSPRGATRARPACD